MSLIIINVSNIGDIVSSLSLVKLLSKYYKIYFITDKELLLKTESYINLVYLDKNHNYNIACTPPRKVIDLTSSRKSRKIIQKILINGEKFHGKKIGGYENFKSLMKKYLYYDILIKKNKYQHIVKDYYAYLDAFSISCKELDKYPLMQEDKNIKKYDNKKIISIHIGSANPIRSIPLKLIFEIISYLTKEKKCNIYLLGDDEELINPILKKFPKVKYEKTNLNLLKVLIKKSILFIGPDSGLLHMSSALDTNSIGIFGPNISSRCAPLNKKVKIIEKNFSCRPCLQNQPCKFNRKCLLSIDFNKDVEPKIKKILHKN